MTRLYACWCHDADASADLLEAHLAHVDRYAVAGPLKRAGETVGSLLVIKAEDDRSARSFLQSDPYFAAGVWSTVEIEELRAVAGDWVGGVGWKTS